jgi:hypothetical protein
VIVVVQQVERVGVVGDQAEQGGSFVCADGRLVQRVLHHSQRQAQLPEAALVDGVAAHEMIAQHVGRPDAELRAAPGVDAVADRQDGNEVEVFYLVGLPVGGSCCILCNN